MNRLVRGSVLLAAAFLASCGGDPTADQAAGVVQVTADPSIIFITNAGDSQAVLVEAVNALGQQDAATFTLNNVSAGLTVRQDVDYAPFTNGGHVDTRSRFFVKAASTTSFVDGSFTVNAGGKSLTIKVKIVPASLDIAFSNPTPALGEVVTLTTPASTVHFTTASAVTVTGGTAVITGLNADSTVMSLLLGPGVNASTARVTNMVVDYLPGQHFALSTTGTVTTPVVANIASTVNKPTPAVGDTVTITAVAPFQFLQTATLTFGGNPVIVLSRAVDGSSITFIPYPGPAGATSLAISGAILNFLPAVPLNLPSQATMNMPTELAGTGAFATAPTITIPATGLVSTIVDAGGFTANATCTGDLGGPCRIYKFVLAGTRTFQVSATWQARADLGFYFYDATPNLLNIFGCDAHGNAATAQPETCTLTLGAGTYYIVNDTFAAFYGPPDNVNPLFVRIDITGQ